MSGIAGIYYLDDRPVDRADLERMVDILAHRGPEGADVWCEGFVGLGHRMLWTTPESLLEQLPLKDRTGNLILTADARIDNRDELISALSLNDRPAEKITDSDLILATYEKWGDRCPEKLIGDFAFAIWDGRNQKLFCARDHFGIKPFYYYYQPGKVFVLASEIKALYTLPSHPRRINELREAEYLLNILEKANTFYQDIFRLPAGHKMTVTHKSIKLCSYWSLDPSRELRLGSNNEYAEAFSEIFTESVHCRLRSAYSIGSTLSGGLDSSSITCAASKLLLHNGNQPLHTFSTVFDEIPECDERSFINAVLVQEKENLIPHYINGDHLSPLTDIDRVLWHQDEPFFAANLFLYWNLCRSVKSSGVRILLDGLDGDTVISHGMGYLTELASTGKWFSLTKELIGCTMLGY